MLQPPKINLEATNYKIYKNITRMNLYKGQQPDHVETPATFYIQAIGLMLYVKIREQFFLEL